MLVHGTVTSGSDGIFNVVGLSNVFLGELVYFKFPKSTWTGQVFNIEKNGNINVVLLSGSTKQIFSSDKVYGSRYAPMVKTGYSVLGQVLRPTGECVNDVDFSKQQFFIDKLFNTKWSYIETNAPGITKRFPVKTPVLTGINAVDTLIPIGCGQRELIIGDKNCGKTTLGVTIILNQRYVNRTFNANWRLLESYSYSTSYINNSLRPCIYVSVGQRRSEISRIYNTFKNLNVMNYVTILFSCADDNPGLQYISPYAGTAIGEWFRDRGYNSIIVTDDLSNHAVAYRQLSLLLRRPPGREAYPGDIFYIHSRLLERSAQLAKHHGSGSLTSFPLIETKGNDISAFIPTNVISITDGQIYLSLDMILQGIRPAINIGLSVSRIGSSAQYEILADLSKKLKKDYVLYQSYKGVEKIGGITDPVVLSYIKRGRRILQFFKQSLFETCELVDQIICLFNLVEGYVDNVLEYLIGLYFKFIFNSGISGLFLSENDNHNLGILVSFHSIYEPFFFTHSISLISKQLNLWSSTYQAFFIAEVQPRIRERDVSDYRKALAGFFKNL